MTLYDVRELFVDDSQLVRIYNVDTDEYIYEGEFIDLSEDMEDREVCSIDSLYPCDYFDGYVTINVEE